MTTKLPELWLQFAADDLKSANVLLAEGLYNIVCFHSQQAVEKLFNNHASVLEVEKWGSCKAGILDIPFVN